MFGVRSLLLAGVLVVSGLSTGCNQERNESIRLMNEGLKLYRHDRLVKAVDRLAQAASVDPTNDKALFYEGMVRYQKLGELAKGEARIRKAIELNATEYQYHYHLGAILSAQKNFPGAVGAFKKALALKGDHAESHLRLGQAQEAQDKFDLAQESYREAVKANPRMPEAYNALGTLYLRFEKYAQAAQVLRNSIENAPSFSPNYRALGLVYQAQKRYDDAIREFEKSLSLSPSDASTLFNLGMTYAANDNPEMAVRHLKRYQVQKTMTEDAVRAQIARDMITRMEAGAAH